MKTDPAALTRETSGRDAVATGSFGQAPRTTDKAMEDAARLHEESIVFDMVAPLFTLAYPRGVLDCLAGGLSAIGATVTDRSTGFTNNAAEGFSGIAHAYDLIRQMPDRLRLIEAVEDFARARQDGKLGIVLHFQTCSPFEQELRYVEIFYRLGVRAALLTYNIRNLVADGCTERTDSGLSRLGVRLVQEMNRVGMVVDGSHTGLRSSLDAIEVSEAPFIFSHSGARAVYDHPRNITDEQIRACARTGGVVGVFVLPYFLGDADDPKLDTLVRHIAYIAELVGSEHVGIGMDYSSSISPYSTVEEQQITYEGAFASGQWREGDFPPPPWRCAPEIETPAGMRNLTAALLRHGFSYDEVRGIMGENFLRVFRAVWKPIETPGG
jgi:membrane dipeptidase